MARLLWLADVLRGAGLTVHEVAGWRTRGDESYGPVRGVIIHETRGSATSTDAAELNVLINGRVGLSGPISQLYLSRSGAWHVVASGTCHHVKTGWGGPFSGLGNDSLLGIEAQHGVDSQGRLESWAGKPVQYDSYVRGVAAILRHTGWPAPVGHKEHQPGDKPDPAFDMARFRADVATIRTQGVDMPLTPNEHAELVEGSLTPQNVLHYRLRSILDGADPSLADYFAKGWTQYVGLKQLAEAQVKLADGLTALAQKVDALAANVAELAARPPVVVDAAALVAALQSPEVAEVLNKAAFFGAQRAEQE